MDGRQHLHGRQWLHDHQHRLADLRARAEGVQARLAGVTGTATSSDGAVTVTVAPGGALRALDLGPRADDLSRTQLAALVVATAAEATAAAQGTVAEVAAPLLGEAAVTAGGFRFAGIDDHIARVDAHAARMERVVAAARSLDHGAYGIIGQVFTAAASAAADEAVASVRRLEAVGAAHAEGLRWTRDAYRDADHRVGTGVAAIEGAP